MLTREPVGSSQVPLNPGDRWVAFPGGELEGERPKALCAVCKEAAARTERDRRPSAVPRRTLCFQCYRAGIERERSLKAAGSLDTASVDRYQSLLPFEPVNRPRLEMLKVERSAARAALSSPTTGRFANRRRQAQIAARHALQRIVAGAPHRAAAPDRAREIAAAIHAAELQLPESWLPFVVCQ
jgi:hypothetical protein